MIFCCSFVIASFSCADFNSLSTSSGFDAISLFNKSEATSSVNPILFLKDASLLNIVGALCVIVLIPFSSIRMSSTALGLFSIILPLTFIDKSCLLLAKVLPRTRGRDNCLPCFHSPSFFFSSLVHVVVFICSCFYLVSLYNSFIMRTSARVSSLQYSRRSFLASLPLLYAML